MKKSDNFLSDFLFFYTRLGEIWEGWEEWGRYEQ